MKPSWHIREAIPEDSNNLKLCMTSAYIGYQKRMAGIRLPPMDADYSSEIKNYPTWVVESDRKILAGLIMVFDNNEASIANIAVDPDFQGLGIGGELMRFAELKAKEKNISTLNLATHILLEENISLYRYLGWREAERDESRVFMKKNVER